MLLAVLLVSLLSTGRAIGIAPSIGARASPAPSCRENDHAELAKLVLALRGANKWSRMRAVRGLAELGSLAAWEAVVSALGDRNGEVADTAQWSLQAMDDASELALVLGRGGLGSRDEWTRARAAEALGRLGVPPGPDVYVRAMGDRDAFVRRMLLWSVERAARAGTLARNTAGVDRLEERVAHAFLRDREARNRARAAFALAALAPARWEEELARLARPEAFDDEVPEVRCAIAALACPSELASEAGGAASEAGIGALVHGAKDPDRAVRVQAAEGLAGIGTRAALLGLVDRLESEDVPRVRGRLVDLLQRASGRKHRDDPRPWRAWLEALPPSWRAASVEHRPGELAMPEEERSVSTTGLPIPEGEVALLIDLSGSMWTVRDDGSTRKDAVAAALATTLARLEPGTRFNVIPFTERPRPWRDEVVDVTPRNVRSATRFFADCHDRGTGNLWDAVLLAFEDPAVDTLVLLTDGEPTGGRRNRLEIVLPLFEEHNATRKVRLDVFLVGAPATVRDAWTSVAERTGGRCVAVDF